MKKIIFFILCLLSFAALADETYRCRSLQRVNGWRESADLILKTGFFSDKIKGAQMITADLKGSDFEEIDNPFTADRVEYYKIDAEEAKIASKMKFRQLRKSGLSQTNSIAVTEPMLNFSRSGYVYYHYRLCILGNCNYSNYYFKCDRI
jgi:hypothetical protein